MNLTHTHRSAPSLPIDSARAYAQASRAERTKETYRRAWGAFRAWCEERGLDALPAARSTVAMYLAARADAGRRPATLELDLAAIGEAHRAAGFDSPRGAAEVRAVLQGVRRTVGAAQRRVAPLLPGEMRAIVRALGEGKKAARDRALLLLGWAAALRRSELVALRVEDLRWAERGLEVVIRRSKTDQEGRGLVKAVPRAASADVCPVRAVRAWLDVAGIESGPIFREVTRHGKVGDRALTGRSVARVVQAACARAGLSGDYSGHSLRAGLATAAAKAGKSVHAIMRQTGHASLAMVQRYVRERDLWADNAAEGLL